MLADQKVPLEDSDKLRLMVHNQVYHKMLGDSAWVQESLVSAAIAREARQQADLGHAFNFQADLGSADADGIGLDPLWPGHDDLRLGHRHRAEHRVHHSSSPLGRLYLAFGNDAATKTQYKVSSIQSDTS